MAGAPAVGSGAGTARPSSRVCQTTSTQIRLPTARCGTTDSTDRRDPDVGHAEQHLDDEQTRHDRRDAAEDPAQPCPAGGDQPDGDGEGERNREEAVRHVPRLHRGLRVERQQAEALLAAVGEAGPEPRDVAADEHLRVHQRRQTQPEPPQARLHVRLHRRGDGQGAAGPQRHVHLAGEDREGEPEMGGDRLGAQQRQHDEGAERRLHQHHDGGDAGGREEPPVASVTDEHPGELHREQQRHDAGEQTMAVLEPDVQLQGGDEVSGREATRPGRAREPRVRGADGAAEHRERQRGDEDAHRQARETRYPVRSGGLARALHAGRPLLRGRSVGGRGASDPARLGVSVGGADRGLPQASRVGSRTRRPTGGRPVTAVSDRPATDEQDLDLLAINTVRTLAMDAVQRAESGHPGTPMALAPLAYLLYTRHMAHDPGDPEWFDRDRFVLSAGHASMLQYAALHLTGYDLSLDDLKDFRQLHSRTPGHPERGLTPGIETTTGPLGQGFGSAVGLAMAEQVLAARFNTAEHTVVDHRTWVIASDGDLMEGVQSEAASLAGQLALSKLIVFYDDNKVTLDGPASLHFTVEDPGARYAAYGWRVLEVSDVNELDELDRVIAEAAESDGRPTLVRVRSVIGFGAPNLAGTNTAHGSPLGDEEVAGAKRQLGWPYDEPFTVPDEVRREMDQHERGRQLRVQWQERMDAWRAAEGGLAAEFDRRLAGELPDDWDAGLDDLAASFEVGEGIATRKASGAVINHLAERVPELLSGSADLSSSNATRIDDGGDLSNDDWAARNVNYGVREHAMAAALNGLASHGGLRPFGATFTVFTDYLRPSLRLACVMGLPVIYVTTHDSIGLGEDGTTHQPIEHLAALRAIPDLHVLRPADARETVGAWRHALARTDGPTLLVLSRQGLPVLSVSDHDAVGRGVYSVRDVDEPDVVLLATGSEVPVALEAATRLDDEHDVRARVVSMPCWELAEELDEEDLETLLPEEVPVLSVEAASSFGWARWADDSVSIDEFGESAPGGVLMAEYGFTPEDVAEAAVELLDDDLDEE